MDLLFRARRVIPEIPSVAVVNHGDIPGAVMAMKAGAADCLEKPIEPDRLFSAVEKGLSQRPEPVFLSAQVLTKTELDVLDRVLIGKSSSEIAAALHRSKRTIEVHRRHIMRKLQASSIVDLVRRAVTLGLVDPKEWGRPGAE